MNELIVTLMAFGLTVSQVFTKPVEQVRTQFNPQTDQAVVGQSLREGCAFMLKTFKSEKIDAEPLFLLMIENAKREREEVAAKRAEEEAKKNRPEIVDEGEQAPAATPEPAAAPAAPPATVPPAAPAPTIPTEAVTLNPKNLKEKIRLLDPELLLTLYKAYCKNESVDTSAVKLDQVITYYNSVMKDLPDVRGLKGLRLPEATVVLDRNGERFTEIYGQGNRRKHIPISEIPKFVQQLFISAEDKDFYNHNGLAPAGVARAVMSSYASDGRPQGGSTITQQVIKNLVLNDDLSFERKMREMILAQRLEKALKKDEILELYLNMVYLGRSSWGVEMAAQSYFKKSVRDLTLPQAALLAGITPGPNKFNPDRNAEGAKDRRQKALFRFKEDSAKTPKPLSEDEFQTASAAPIQLEEFEGPARRGAYYFLDVINREARELHKIDLTKKTYVVRSTIHAPLQKQTEKILQDSLYDYEVTSKRSGQWVGPRGSLKDDMEKIGADWKALLKDRTETYDGQWPLAIVLSTRPMRVGLPNGKELPLRGTMVNRLKRHDLVFVAVDGEEAWLKITPVVVGSIRRDLRDPNITWLEALQRTKGHFFDVPWTLAVVLDERNKRVGLSDGRIVSLRGPPTLLQALQPHDLIFVHEPQQNSATLKIPPAVQGAIVVMENKTGRILSMAGGFSYGDSKYNRAYTAARQPGSTLKPFIHLAALNAEMQPNTLIPDVVPHLPKLCNNWNPKNYDGGSRGLVTMRQAIEMSLNLPTIRIMTHLGRNAPEGLDYVRALTQELGIYKATERCYPFVLGSQPARLIDLAVAYATVANSALADSQYAELKPVPRFFDTVAEEGREVVPQPRYNRQVTPSIDSVAYYQLRRILEGTLIRGTATKLKDLAGYVAGKTGTSNDENDAWFIGFTNDIVVAVWVGYDSRNVRQNLGDRFTGGRLALPIAEKVLRTSFELYHQPEPLAPRSAYLRSQTAEYPIDLHSGNFGGGFQEIFRRDSGGRNVIDSRAQILEPHERMMGVGRYRGEEDERALGWDQREYGVPPGYHPPRPPPGYYQPGYDDQYDMWRQRQRRIDPYFQNPFGRPPRQYNPYRNPWGGN